MMSLMEISPELKEWIVQDLTSLGIVVPKLKKIIYQINKRNLKTRTECVFGASIIQQITTTDNKTSEIVPLFLVKATNHLLPQLEHKCIFRKRGQDMRMKQLKIHIEGGGDFPSDVYPDDVASLIKAWLRELPVPLLPNEFHEFILNCHQVSKENESSTALLLGLTLLPAAHLSTLKFILIFLYKTAALNPINGMSSESLAVVFAPNIFPGSLKNLKVEKTSAKLLKEQEEKERMVVRWLIDHAVEVSGLPESVRLLTSLCEQDLETLRENLKRQKKRRKSMTGFTEMVGGKIKKIVTTDKNNTPGNKDAGATRRRSVRRSIRGNTKRLLSTAPLERPVTTPKKISIETPCDKNKESCKKKKNRIPLSPCCGEVNAKSSFDGKNLGASFEHNISIGSKTSSESVDNVFEETREQDVPNVPIATVAKSDSFETADIIISPSVSIGTNDCLGSKLSIDVIALETAENECDWSRSVQHRSAKRSLKRGRPNTLASGLKSSNRKCKKRSNSSVSYISYGSIRSVRKARRSISNCDFTKQDDKFDDCKTSNSNISIQSIEEKDFNVQKKLDFSAENTTPTKLPSAFTKMDHDELNFISFGFSPDLENSRINTTTKTDFKALTPQSLDFSEITVANSTVDLSANLIEDILKDSTPQIQSENEFGSQNNTLDSPIQSTGVVMTSTPAKGVVDGHWECAQKYLSHDSSQEDSNSEGTKRDSIVELKKRNAGKVLANVQLYNTIQNTSFGCSPGYNNRFKRNAIATMSVREKSTQFKDSQGFVVPKGIPSSAKRCTSRNLQYSKFNNTPGQKKLQIFNHKMNDNVDTLCSQTKSKALTPEKEIDSTLLNINLRRSPRLLVK